MFGEFHLIFPSHSAAYAIIAGLQSVSTSRLSNTWERIRRKVRQKHESLTHLFDIKRNHKAYRKVLSQISAPVVPYLGLISQMFVNFEESVTFNDNEDIVLQVLLWLFLLSCFSLLMSNRGD